MPRNPLRSSGPFMQAVCLLATTLCVQREALAANRDVCSTCTYTTVGAAANAASSGDVIRVAEGSYSESMSLPDGVNLTLQGGYNSTFTSRDVNAHESIVDRISMGGSHSGNVSIDGFTVTAGSGINTQSAATNLTVTNCKIHHNSGPGIFAYQAGTVTISNNVFYANGSYGGVQIGAHTQATITNNVAYSQACFYCAGIYLNAAKTGDVVSDNTLYDNYFGLNIQAASTSDAPEVSNNTIYENSTNGIYSISGSTAFKHNIVTSTGLTGIYHIGSTNVSFLSNVIAESGARGIQIVGSGAASPTFKNNIFYRNSAYPIMIAGNDAGYGGTSTVPAALSYNCFDNPGTAAYMHASLYPAYSYNVETPGAWSGINEQSWTVGNFIGDAGFVDPANYDYRLKPTSFLIDEGDPADSYSNEPASNGSRINIGVYGNTSSAETSPTAPTVSGVSATADGSGMSIGFTTNTATDYLWVTAELWNGSGYTTIPPAKLSGSDFVNGYKTGRVGSGSAKSLTYADAVTDLANQYLASAKVRITVEHGGVSSSSESGSFSYDYVSPSVSITLPTDGSSSSSTKPSFTASASDSGTGILRVKFQYKLAADSTFSDISSDTSAPYAADWGGTSLTAGQSYDLRAVATDVSGNETQSTARTINVCGYSLDVNSSSVTATGGTAQVALTVLPSDCSWAASSNSGWLQISSSAGSSNHSFTVTYAENAEQSSRSGTINIADKVFTLNQSAANAPAVQKTLQLSKSPAAGGTVSSNVGGLSCGVNCSSSSVQYDINTQVVISATPADGYRFVGWSGSSCAGNESCTVTLSDNATVQALFLLESQIQLRIDLEGDGAGTVKVLPKGTSCGTGCYQFSKRRNKPVAVTLTAQPKKNSKFKSWVKGCRRSAECKFNLADDREVSATFVRKPR